MTSMRHMHMCTFRACTWNQDATLRRYKLQCSSNSVHVPWFRRWAILTLRLISGPCIAGPSDSNGRASETKCDHIGQEATAQFIVLIDSFSEIPISGLARLWQRPLHDEFQNINADLLYFWYLWWTAGVQHSSGLCNGARAELLVLWPWDYPITDP